MDAYKTMANLSFIRPGQIRVDQLDSITNAAIRPYHNPPSSYKDYEVSRRKIENMTITRSRRPALTSIPIRNPNFSKIGTLSLSDSRMDSTRTSLRLFHPGPD